MFDDGSQYIPLLHHPQMILNTPISFMDPTVAYLTIAIYWPIALDLYVTVTAVLPEKISYMTVSVLFPDKT